MGCNERDGRVLSGNISSFGKKVWGGWGRGCVRLMIKYCHDDLE